MDNLFARLSPAADAEITDLLLDSDSVRIERIVSTGQASPEDFWYDQARSEWVVVLQGRARLQFEDRVVDLAPGDHVQIPAHCRHRVAWTDPDQATVWLAVHHD